MSRVVSPFLPARAKLWIASVDQPELVLRAQYNPGELQIDKQIQWHDHSEWNDWSMEEERDSSTQDDLEFGSVGKRTIQVELLFDGYEKGRSVEPDVARLEVLSTVHRPKGTPEELRPHHCLVGWGAQPGGMRPFPCVIESLTTKYTMWSTDGRSLRATCTVKLKEAKRLSRASRALPFGGRSRER
jgi:hypothetical protein